MENNMSEALIFDSHAHYDDPAFDEDRGELLASLREGGVGLVMDVSADFKDIPKVLKLSSEYDFIYAAVGIHPSNLEGIGNDEFEELERLSKEPKVKAIGEIGLDYHYEETNKPLQKEGFARQIDLAKRRRLPVIIHSRDAASDTFEIMRSEKAEETGGVIHCFSYEKEMAARFLDLGYYLGIGGVVTYKNARKIIEVVEYTPLERILLETDCPYMSPVPFRGKRNDSRLIKYAALKISEIKNVSMEEVIRVCADNALRMYQIDQGI